MKRSELIFVSSLIPADIFASIGAFVLAYFTRLHSNIIYIWTFSDYFKFVLWMVFAWIIIFAVNGHYKIKNLNNSALDELTNIVAGVSTGIMLVVGYIFLSRTEFFSRLVVIYAWLYAILLIFVAHSLIKVIRSILLKYGVGVHQVIIIGNGSVATEIITNINGNYKSGKKIVKIIDRSGIQKIESILMRTPADEIIIVDPNISDSEIEFLMNSTEDYQIEIKLVPNLLRLRESRIISSTLVGVPVITYLKTPLDGWGTIIKRLIDIIGAIFCLILLSPIILTIAILVKLTSDGPVIYKNKRIGSNGEFTTFKFRTMLIEYCTGLEYGGSRAEIIENELIEKKNIKKGSAVYKISNDPRVTKIGSILRKTSLDELPQFINVLIGNMSLVGPRPHQPKEVKNYTKKQRKLLIIKPGITGLAQISGRSDLVFEEEARLDIFYLENWSIGLDIKIILRTFLTIFGSRGAY